MGVFAVGDALAQSDAAHSRQGDDLSGAGRPDRDAPETLVDEQLRDGGRSLGPSAPAHGDCLPVPHGACHDAADRERTQVVVGLNIGDQHLQGMVGISRRRRDLIEDRVEQGPEIGQVRLERPRALSFARDGVEDGEVDLFFGGVEVDEQVVDLVQDLRGPRVLAVDLVDDHDRGQSQFERLQQDGPGLGKRSLGGVDEQHDAVDHAQGTFDLAAEVGVPRCVDDVDLDLAVGHGGVLRHDRDALLAFQVHRVEHAVTDLLVHAERAALPQHGVHERGLAVVDMRNDRYVAKIHSVLV